MKVTKKWFISKTIELFRKDIEHRLRYMSDEDFEYVYRNAIHSSNPHSLAEMEMFWKSQSI